MTKPETMVHNPLMWADVPDVDVIRVGDIFYMVSTSMHSMPGCPIMKSKDLAHWELVNYVFNTFEDTPGHNLLDGKGIYGQGSWAASLRYHKGIFYVCFNCNDTHQFYIYRTKDIENGPWERSVFQEFFHDPALFFDDDDRVYVIYGGGSIHIAELTEDLRAVKPDGIRQLLMETETEGISLRCEGGHAYKINGMYYLFYIEWPNTGSCMRREICYRSTSLLGPYERRIVLEDDMGYHNKGVAQGAIFDLPDGSWCSMLFQDHDAVGRIPYLLPLRWEEGWPVLGNNGKIPESFTVPLQTCEEKPLVISDDFNHTENRLALNWQWNHNPENSLWSFTERPGYLRLHTGIPAESVLTAKNTLTQRTEGPRCTAEVKLSLSGLRTGERAGLIALQSHFGTVGIRMEKDGCFLTMCVNNGSGGEKEEEEIPWKQNEVYLKIAFDFTDSRDIAEFFYSEDGEEWRSIGRPLKMLYTLDHFMGYRIGLYAYAVPEAEKPAGYADFSGFRYEKEDSEE